VVEARVLLTGRDGAAVRAVAVDLCGATLARRRGRQRRSGGRAARCRRRTPNVREGHALINGASPRSGSLSDVTEEDWRSGFESVFLWALRIARAVADTAGDGDSIVFVLVATARVPSSRFAISSGLRPGLAMAAKILANELGAIGNPCEQLAAWAHGDRWPS
jgi:3-oxoacyl-[acyl-carrier protein] reductase